MVSLEPTEEQRLLVSTVGKFARERVRPAAREADETGDIPHDILEELWQIGFIQACIPEAYGGLGGERSALTGAMFVEELAWGDLSIALAAMAPALIAFPLLSEGTEEQRAKYLPQLCKDIFPLAGAALIEPVYQFDANDLSALALRDLDDVHGEGSYALNGRKCYVPFAADASLLLIYARDGQVGQTRGFLVERGSAGLEIREREGLMGIKALPTYEVKLTECRVPADQLLGNTHSFDFARVASYSRVALAAMAVGVARGAAEYARDYAKQRHQFGEPIASRQAIAFMLAEMAIEIDATRLMAWEAAWKLDRKEDALREAYLAKTYGDEIVMKVTDSAVQVLGGHGYIREHPVELWLRNARGFTTLDGLAMV